MALSFEELPAAVQQLTFESIESFLRNGIGNRRPGLGDLRDTEGRYTNYAYALSDQNPWHTEIRFEGNTEIIDGPIIRQIDDTVNAVTTHNPTLEIRKRGGMHRRFPSMAIREALVNSVIHSDLQAGDRRIVDMRDGYVSISSPGGVYVSQEWRDVTCTNPRNPRLAALLVQMRYADLKGRGIATIRNCYSGSGLIPCMIKEEDMFSVRLPAMDNPVKEACAGAPVITDYLERNRGALLSDISRDMMVSIHCTKKIIDSMESEGTVFTLGIGSKRRAYLTDPSADGNGLKRRVTQSK